VPERRLPMRQIREVLRLHHEAHLSERQIAHGCRMSRSTVQRYLERAAAANLSWPLPEALDDTQLEQLLFPPGVAQIAVQFTSQGTMKRDPSRPTLEHIDIQDCGPRVNVANPQAQRLSKSYARTVENQQ